jgi:hypothetical protein
MMVEEKESALGGHHHLSDGLQTERKATTKSKQFIS